jgi:four helix bundle protein
VLSVEMGHTPIEETELFQRYEAISDEIWIICCAWADFARPTVGVQLTSSIDSVAANMSEGDGRFGSADALRFFVIARASAREARYWLKRAVRRSLIKSDDWKRLDDQIESANKSLNGLINYQRNSIDTVREERSEYSSELYLKEGISLGLERQADPPSTLNTEHSTLNADFMEDNH